MSLFGPKVERRSAILEDKMGTCYTNTMWPQQNDHQFVDNILKCVCLKIQVCISNKLLWTLVPSGQINNKSALVQAVARRRAGAQPLSKPMTIKFVVVWIVLIEVHNPIRNLIGPLNYHSTKLMLKNSIPWNFSYIIKFTSLLIRSVLHTHMYIYIYNCWKKSNLKSYVRPWFHG